MTPKPHPPAQGDTLLLGTLKARFEANMSRHPALTWAQVEARLQANTAALQALEELERTGGEPDVVDHEAFRPRGTQDEGVVCFCDCAPESPTGRRSLCYDAEALAARKKFKPEGSAVSWAAERGATLLHEAQYMALQSLGAFDQKTSSWLLTPPEVRVRGGALFGDCRYGRVFIYHNGADSYYAVRGFRCALWI